MAFAYQDQYGTLHIVENMNTALNNRGQGQVVETDYPHTGGYPTHKGETIFVYIHRNEAYLGGNTKETGKPYALKDDFALSDIVRKVKGE